MQKKIILEKRIERLMSHSVGRLLGYARRNRGLSQFAVAEKVGVSQQHISNIEGGANFSVYLLVKLLNLYKVKLILKGV